MTPGAPIPTPAIDACARSAYTAVAAVVAARDELNTRVAGEPISLPPWELLSEPDRDGVRRDVVQVLGLLVDRDESDDVDESWDDADYDASFRHVVTTFAKATGRTEHHAQLFASIVDAVRHAVARRP